MAVCWLIELIAERRSALSRASMRAVMRSALLQGAERGVVERVDDELEHGRNMAGRGGDEMVIAGGGEDGVGRSPASAGG